MKRQNEYSRLLMDVMPRSVAQAIALSLAVRLSGMDDLSEAIHVLAREWAVLYAAGIVPQEPPLTKLNAIGERVKDAEKS